MAPPRFLPAIRSERSWVPDSPTLDRGLALKQWHQLRALVEALVGPVVGVPAEPWAPAMTFTRDLAVVADDIVIPLMPHSIRGPFEAPLTHRFLASLGLELTTTVKPLRFDGGNVLADSHGRLLVGVTSDEPATAFVEAVRFLETATGRPAYRVPLTGGRFPHIDMAVCDLDGQAWLVYPDALPGFDMTEPAWNELFLGLPVITATASDGEQLACNLVVSGDAVIGPPISPELIRQLTEQNIHYHRTDLSELRKAGGGAHSLTLELPG